MFVLYIVSMTFNNIFQDSYFKKYFSVQSKISNALPLSVRQCAKEYDAQSKQTECTFHENPPYNNKCPAEAY